MEMRGDEKRGERGRGRKEENFLRRWKWGRGAERRWDARKERRTEDGRRENSER